MGEGGRMMLSVGLILEDVLKKLSVGFCLRHVFTQDAYQPADS